MEKIHRAGETVFGHGVLSMVEYYFMIKNDRSPFAMLFSEPRTFYNDWVWMFKGEKPVRKLLEKWPAPDTCHSLKASRGTIV